MSFHVPAAVGQGGKQDSAWAVSQVKVNTPDAPYAGLNPRYHDHWQGRAEDLLDILFQDHRYDSQLSELAGEGVYKPWDCLSAAANHTIVDDFRLLARVHGVSRDRRTIVLVDNYKDTYTNCVWPEVKTRCLASMLPWQAERCIYHYARTGDTHVVAWDAAEWARILPRLQAFAEDAKARLTS